MRELESLVGSGDLRIVASELNLVEMLAGNHRPSFIPGVASLFSVSPRWLLMTGLGTREVAQLYDGPNAPSVETPAGAFLEWPEFVGWIVSRATIDAIPNLTTPTAEALLEAFPAGTTAASVNDLRDQLHELRDEVRDMLTYLDTPQNLFRVLVASALRNNFGATRELADRLWANPDLAPAFRLEAELSCRVLNVEHPKWTTNDFVDHGHVAALGYVDLFVTRDGLGRTPGMIQKIEWYDQAVREPRGLTPYSTKLCRGWSELLRKL